MFIEDLIISRVQIIYGLVGLRMMMNASVVFFLDLSNELLVVFVVLLTMDFVMKFLVIVYYWPYTKTICVACKTYEEKKSKYPFLSENYQTAC